MPSSSSQEGKNDVEEKPFAIDKHKLDEECEKQALLMQRMCKILAKAEKRMNDAETELKLVEAEMELLVRTDPTKYLPKAIKVTENVIDALVKTSKRYKEAARELNDAKYAVGVAKGGIKAADHKKWMIEELCSMDARSYFGEPRTPGVNGKLPVLGAKRKSKTTDED